MYNCYKEEYYATDATMFNSANILFCHRITTILYCTPCVSIKVLSLKNFTMNACFEEMHHTSIKKILDSLNLPN